MSARTRSHNDDESLRANREDVAASASSWSLADLLVFVAAVVFVMCGGAAIGHLFDQRIEVEQSAAFSGIAVAAALVGVRAYTYGRGH